MLERQNKMKECLDDDSLLDNYDLSKLLGVTHSTEKYRTARMFLYYIVQGKALYKELEICEILGDSHKRCVEEQRWV